MTAQPDSRTHYPPTGEWAIQAACKGARGVMDGERIPGKGGGTSWAQARRFCASCPVKAECLAHALEHEEPHGMWGGQTPSQRKAITSGKSLARDCTECGGEFTPPQDFGRQSSVCSDVCYRRRNVRQSVEGRRRRNGTP